MDDKRNILLNNNNMVQILDRDIKQEYVGVEVKIEYDDTTNSLEQVTVKAEFDELYKNHIIKQEIVIGPEIIQKTTINKNMNKKRHISKPENAGISKSEKARRSKHKTAVSKTKNRGMSKRKSSISNNVEGISIKHENRPVSKPNSRKSKSKDNTKQINSNKQECFECDMCHKIFSTRSDIEDHIKTCTCHICGKHYTFLTNLYRHLLVHTGSKKHECSYCNATFSRKDYLEFHLSKHTNSILPKARKPAQCELCNKMFSSNYSRKWHIVYSCPKNMERMELKKKWYACDMCDKGYKYRSSLSAHIVKVHMGVKDKKKHECDYCGAIYVKKHNLQCHIQWNHMKMRPYKCRYCREKFTWHSTLATHEFKVHGKERFKKIA